MLVCYQVGRHVFMCYYETVVMVAKYESNVYGGLSKVKSTQHMFINHYIDVGQSLREKRRVGHSLGSIPYTLTVHQTV